MTAAVFSSRAAFAVRRRRTAAAASFRSFAVRSAGAAVAFALAVLGAACGASGPSRGAESAGGERRAWTWTDDEGRDVALAGPPGAVVVVAPIYTRCTVRCPLTIDKLRRLDASLRGRHLEARIFLVTLDPDHDDVPRLRRFRQSRSLPSSWSIVRGDRDETRALARLLGVRAIVDDGHIDHDVRIATFDSSGRMTHDFAGWDFDENVAASGP